MIILHRSMLWLCWPLHWLMVMVLLYMGLMLQSWCARHYREHEGMKNRGGNGWDGDGDGGAIARRRESGRRRMWWLMGCQLTVHMELFLRAELPRLAEHRPSVSLSARSCFRNSLCSSLESLYLLPPRGAPGVERAHKWGYLSTLYNGVPSQLWAEKNKDEINLI